MIFRRKCFKIRIFMHKEEIMNKLILLPFLLVLTSGVYTIITRKSLGIHQNERFSICSTCHHRLSPIDLLPIVGYLLRWGRCHYCHAIIPAFSFWLELLTLGLLLILPGWPIPFFILFYTLLIFSIQDHYNGYI